MDAVNGNATVNLYCIERCNDGIWYIHEETFEQRRNENADNRRGTMKNYGRMHRAETMYCMLLPYKDAMKEDVPAKIRLMLAVNKWTNPWHALTELSKEIPFKRRQKIKELNDEKRFL